MPLFLDRHDLPGATAQDLAHAHVKDLDVQDKFGVRYISYWFDPKTETAFCLAEGPDMQAVNECHKQSHGLEAARIIEVDPSAVGAFLGRITDHPAGEPYVETAVRAILFTDMAGSTQMTGELGDAGAMSVLHAHDHIVRSCLSACDGNEVKHTGDGIMASFSSVTKSIECSINMQREFAAHNDKNEHHPVRVKIGLSVGEPVTENGDLFGAAVQLAARMCEHAEPEEVLVPAAVKDMAMGKGYHFEGGGPVELKGFAEPVSVFRVVWR